MRDENVNFSENADKQTFCMLADTEKIEKLINMLLMYFQSG